MNQSLERLNNVMRAVKSKTTYMISVDDDGSAMLWRFDEKWRSHNALELQPMPVEQLNPLIDIYTTGIIDMKVLL